MLDTRTYDLFVVYAVTDAEFVRGYLLPALNLPSSRVLLVDELPLGGVIVSEVDRGVTWSRFTVAVLSPSYLADRWAVFGEQLASHLSVDDTRIIPLRLTACDLPLRLDARVSLDFTDGAGWDTQTGRLRDLVHAPPPAPEPIGTSPAGVTMAPSVEEWEALSPAERAVVVVALPGEVTYDEMAMPEGDRHYKAKARALDALRGYFTRQRRRIGPPSPRDQSCSASACPTHSSNAATNTGA